MKSHDPVKVFSTLAVRAPFDDHILAAYRRQGGELAIAWSPTTVIESKIDRGETADVVIATEPLMRKLLAEDKILPDSCVPLVDAYIGVAVKQGAARPDISTVEKCLKAFRAARSVAYSLGGASGIYFQQMLKAQQMLDDINRRATTVEQGFTAEKIISGEADIAIQQMSELMVVPGIDIVGPLPDAIQHYTPFSVGLFAQSANKTAAQAFIDFLSRPDAQAAYARNGLKFRTK